MDDAAERMMPGLAPLDADQALLLKLRMFHLRRAPCPMVLAHRTFIADVCHRDPAALTAEQRAHVGRAAGACRPSSGRMSAGWRGGMRMHYRPRCGRARTPMRPAHRPRDGARFHPKPLEPL